jgi:hypothetical protein
VAAEAVVVTLAAEAAVFQALNLEAEAAAVAVVPTTTLLTFLL